MRRRAYRRGMCERAFDLVSSRPYRNAMPGLRLLHEEVPVARGKLVEVPETEEILLHCATVLFYHTQSIFYSVKDAHIPYCLPSAFHFSFPSTPHSIQLCMMNPCSMYYHRNLSIQSSSSILSPKFVRTIVACSTYIKRCVEMRKHPDPL